MLLILPERLCGMKTCSKIIAFKILFACESLFSSDFNIILRSL